MQEYSSGAPVKAVTGRCLLMSCKIECELFEAGWVESVLVFAIEISRQYFFGLDEHTISVATDVAMSLSYCCGTLS